MLHCMILCIYSSLYNTYIIKQCEIYVSQKLSSIYISTLYHYTTGKTNICQSKNSLMEFIDLILKFHSLFLNVFNYYKMSNKKSINEKQYKIDISKNLRLKSKAEMKFLYIKCSALRFSHQIIQIFANGKFNHILNIK